MWINFVTKYWDQASRQAWSKACRHAATTALSLDSFMGIKLSTPNTFACVAVATAAHLASEFQQRATPGIRASVVQLVSGIVAHNAIDHQ